MKHEIEEYEAYDETDFIACLLLIGPPGARLENDWQQTFKHMEYMSRIAWFFEVRFPESLAPECIRSCVDFRNDYMEWLKEKTNEKNNRR